MKLDSVALVKAMSELVKPVTTSSKRKLTSNISLFGEAGAVIVKVGAEPSTFTLNEAAVLPLPAASTAAFAATLILIAFSFIGVTVAL